MSNFITFKRHATSDANLSLDRKKVTEYVLNLDKIDFISFDEQFDNGYGERLPRLEINIAGEVIVLYRDDALTFFKVIKEFELWQRE